jgi:RNA polymerase sigma factor (sigma-70 family)
MTIIKAERISLRGAMTEHSEQRARCLTLLASLSQVQSWQLTEGQQLEYAAAVEALLPADVVDEEILKRLYNYHQDHTLVRALRDHADPGHDSAWSGWCASALRIIQRAGYTDASHPLMNLDDLAQSALEELVQALPEYAYRSRFSTWAYPIIVRAARHAWVHLRAAKRSGPTVALNEEIAEAGPTLSEREHPEQVASANELAALVQSVLVARKDERLALIFRLWAEEDRRLVDIASIVGLDASRVSVLLKQARLLLQENPSIRAWGSPELDYGSASDQSTQL